LDTGQFLNLIMASTNVYSSLSHHQSIIRRLGNLIVPIADQIMTRILTIMSSASKNSTVMEDAFLVVGALTAGTVTLLLRHDSMIEILKFLVAAVETEFIRYMESFTPFLITALQNHEEHQVLFAIPRGNFRATCLILADYSLDSTGTLQMCSIA